MLSAMLPALDVRTLHVQRAFTSSGPVAQRFSTPARSHRGGMRAQASTVAHDKHLHGLDSAKSALVALSKEGRASLSFQRRGVMEEAQVTPAQFCAQPHAVLLQLAVAPVVVWPEQMA